MFIVYILKSVNFGCRYVGSTGDLKQRLSQHNEGLARYTKGRRPWELIYFEEYSTRAEAMRREKFLKSGRGRKELDKILPGNRSISVS